MNMLKVLSCLALGLLMSCAVNPDFNPSKAHHTRSGFKNIGFADSKGFWEFSKWRWQRLFKDIPAAEDYHFELVKPPTDLLRNNTDRATLTWIGHATFLIQFSGLNILTDPQFSERASPVSWAGPERAVPPAMAIDSLPDIDAVVISHDHYDALDHASIVALAGHNQKQPLTFVVPLGMNSWFADIQLGTSRVIELDWGQSHTIDGVTFTAEPSQHWGKRTLFDAFQRLWASWVIEAREGRIYFAGDTGYADIFKQIGTKYGGFDLALLPIGAYEPRWFMKPYHVNPDESVQIHLDVQAKHSVAMHWGTFILTDEPLDEPPVKLAEALEKHRIDATKFTVFKHGETRMLDHLFAGPGTEKLSDMLVDSGQD